jgi:hypothetical protein
MFPEVVSVFVTLFSFSRLSDRFLRTGEVEGFSWTPPVSEGVTLTEQHGIQKEMGLAE